jgi:hypothetical protein
MVCLTCRRDSTRLKSGNCRFLENSVKAQDDGNWVPTESYRLLFLSTVITVTFLLQFLRLIGSILAFR